MKRLLSLLLAACLLLPFAACRKQETDQLAVVTDGKLTIAYDKTMLTSREAQRFAREIEQQTGFDVSVYSTLTDETTVILGDLDCEPCRLANDNLRANDWTTGVYGDKYVVGARTAETLQAAMEHFSAEVLARAENGTLTVTAAENKTVTGEYRVTGVTVGGAPAGRTAIVIPAEHSASEYRTAVLLRETLLANTGYLAAVAVGEAPENATAKVLVGTSLCRAAAEGQNGYVIAVEDAALEVAAASQFGYEAVQAKLAKSVFPAVEGEIALTAGTVWRGDGDGCVSASAERAGEVRIMMHNAYGHNEFREGEAYNSEQRMRMAAEIYAYYMPDIIGFQEFHNPPRTYLPAMLKALGYEEVMARPKNGGGTNSTPLFYRTDTVECLSYGCLWYANIDFSDPVYAALIGDADVATVQAKARENTGKTVTWAIFRLKETGEEFLAASTHLWWQNNVTEDDVCRRVQIAILKEYLLEQALTWLENEGRADEAAAFPVIVGGDMNTNANRKSIKYFNKETPVRGTAVTSAATRFLNCNDLSVGEKNTVATHHGYAYYNEALDLYEQPQYSERAYKNSLDYIFVSAGGAENCRVERSLMVGDLYGYLVSDHCPIFTDITLYPNK